MNGWGLGDDSSFITDFSVPGSITDPIPTWQESTSPVTIDPVLLDAQYGAPGVAPTASTYEAAAAGNTTSLVPTSLINALAQAGSKAVMTELAPGPAPRVTVPTTSTASVLTSSSIIKGIPDIAILGIGAVLLISLAGGGGRRRR